MDERFVRISEMLKGFNLNFESERSSLYIDFEKRLDSAEALFLKHQKNNTEKFTALNDRFRRTEALLSKEIQIRDNYLKTKSLEMMKNQEELKEVSMSLPFKKVLVEPLDINKVSERSKLKILSEINTLNEIKDSSKKYVEEELQNIFNWLKEQVRNNEKKQEVINNKIECKLRETKNQMAIERTSSKENTKAIYELMSNIFKKLSDDIANEKVEREKGEQKILSLLEEIDNEISE